MKFSSLSLLLLLCGSLLFGCSESATDSVATDAPASDSLGTATDAPAASEPADSSPREAAVEIDPVINGLTEDYEDLPTEFADIKTAYEKSPAEPEALGNYVATLEQIGMMQLQSGRQDESDQAFVRAGEALAKSMAAGVAFPEPGLPPVVFYNHASVLSRQGKAAEALNVLDQAVKVGFEGPQQIRLDQVNIDPKLAAVRELPEFKEKLATWEAQLEEFKKKREAEMAQHAKEQLASGDSFPFDFDLQDVDGKPLSLAGFKGQVCIVDIWGTWCPPCRQEIPTFVKLQDKYGEYGFQMIGLNQEQGPSEEANIKTVKEFMANNSMNYPCAMIPEEVMAQVPDFQGFPTTLFVDHHGKVRMKTVGFHEYSYMSTILETLLQEQAAEAKRAATN